MGPENHQGYFRKAQVTMIDSRSGGWQAAAAARRCTYRRIVLVGLAAIAPLASACGSSASSAQSTTTLSSACTSANVLVCTGSNRQQLLEQGAKAEGRVEWITTLRQKQLVEPLIAAFNKLYPYITVKFTVTSTNAQIQSIEQAGRTGNYNYDLVDSTLGPVTFASIGYMQPFWSPDLSAYRAVQKSAAAGPVQWVSDIDYYLVTAYNTNLVPPSEAPKTYQDLLNPAFKGKKIIVGTSAGSGGPLFVGNIMRSMGQDKGTTYLQKLSEQQVAITDNAGPQEVQQVASGQFAIGLMNFDDQVQIARDGGQSINIAFLEPVPSTFGTIGILNHAKHPDAAALLLDFIISKQGQTLLRDQGALPAYPGLVPTKAELAPTSGGWKANYISPKTQLADTPAWETAFKKYLGV